MKPLSASQLKAWSDGRGGGCPAKWAAHYIAGIKDESRGGALAGSRVHKLLEDRLVQGIGINPDEILESEGRTYHVGRCAIKMLDALPDRIADRDVEYDIDFSIIDPTDGFAYPFRGRVDARHDGVIYDHKTARDVSYIPKVDVAHKNTGPLKEDIQVAIYVLATLHGGSAEPYVIGVLPGTDTVDCQWTYGTTCEQTSLVARKFTLTRAAAERTLVEVILPIARAIRDAPKDTEWTAFPKNLTACGDYGGCPRRGQCRPDPNLRGLAMLSKSEILAKMAARKAAAAGGEPASPDAPTAPAPDAPPKSRLEEIRARAGQINPTPLTSATVTTREPEPVTAANVVLPLLGTVVEPEPAPKKRGRTPKAAVVAEAQVPEVATASPVSEPEPPIMPADVAPVASVGLSDHERATQEALKNDRINIPPNAGFQVPSFTDAPAPSTTGAPWYVLCIDCVLIGATSTDAAGLIARAAATVCAEADVPDYRVIEYGKGVGFLCAELRSLLTSPDFVSGVCLVTTAKTPEGSATLGVLKEFARYMVIGV